MLATNVLKSIVSRANGGVSRNRSVLKSHSESPPMGHVRPFAVLGKQHVDGCKVGGRESDVCLREILVALSLEGLVDDEVVGVGDVDAAVASGKFIDVNSAFDTEAVVGDDLLPVVVRAGG